MTGFLTRINWVDILMLALLVRIVYISAKTGFVTEFMKMLGVLLACFFAFHYYSKLAAFLGRTTDMLPAVLQVVSFGVIWLVTFWICQLIRNAVFVVFTVETLSLIDRWGAAVVSLTRFFLTASMLLFMFLMTDMPYMETMTISSVSQKYLLRVAPTVYLKATQGIVVKFFPEEQVNIAIADELSKLDAE